MNQDAPFRNSKIALMTGIILSFYQNINAQTLYLLDLGDTGTFKISCGTISSTLWTVNNNSCVLTTTKIQLAPFPLVQNISVSITIEGASLDNADIAKFEYLVNNTWQTESEILGENGFHTYTHSFIVTADGSSFMALRITLSNNNNAETWRVFDEKVIIKQVVVFPVTLLAFTGHKVLEGVTIEWVTASENNCDFFTVKRSSDGKIFNVIKKINGAGNSSAERKYSMVDTKPFYGVNYYLLAQTDFNGTVHLVGNIIAVNNPGIVIPPGLYPNPNNGSSFHIQLNGMPDENISVVIADETGKEVYTTMVLAGAYPHPVGVCKLDKKLTPGMYLVTAIGQNDKMQQKMLVK